jgi:hypothetical protein
MKQKETKGNKRKQKETKGNKKKETTIGVAWVRVPTASFNNMCSIKVPVGVVEKEAKQESNSRVHDEIQQRGAGKQPKHVFVQSLHPWWRHSTEEQRRKRREQEQKNRRTEEQKRRTEEQNRREQKNVSIGIH